MKTLRELREMAGLTQTRAARASGIHRAKLSMAETGEIELSPEEETAVRGALLRAIRERQTQIEGVLAGAQSVHAGA